MLKRQTSSILLGLWLVVIPASQNYNLIDYGFGSGSERRSDSTSFGLQGLVGGLGGDSLVGSNYNVEPGSISRRQASVPGAPVLENPANYYNKLHFAVVIADNPSDTTFAIAISDDSFATTAYIQDDNTIGSALGAEDYRTYVNWGGAGGEFVIGLKADTTYSIKVKARHGEFTEMDFGPVAAAATVSPSISFAVGGIAADTSLEGIVTDVATTSTEVSFGKLPFNQLVEAANSLTAATNGVGGYVVMVIQDDDFKSVDSKTFPPVAGTNEAPANWPGSVITGAYGYHTSDEELGTGTVDRFSADDTFAQFEAVAREVAFSAGPVTDEVTNLVYSIEVGFGQAADRYSHTLTFIASGVF